MDNELRYFLEISEKTVNDVTYRAENWTRFLETTARMYKYSFPKQLMIYAQKSDAIAVADISIWEDKFKRWARPGSTGIALLDDTDGYAGLKFVFDVSDTESSLLNARPVQLWEMRDEHVNSVLAALADNYEDIDDLPLYEAFRSLAKQLAIEYYNNNAQSLSYRAENSLLAPEIAYDFAGTPIEDAANTELEAAFENALSVSIAYSLMSRCGLNVGEYFDEHDFRYISDFNTPEMVYALGTATSELSEQVLRDIEHTIKKYDLTHTSERSKFNEREYDQNPYLQGTGRLSAAQYQSIGAAEGRNIAARKIRANEEGFSQETSDDRIQSSVIDGAIVPASAGYGRGGNEASGADNEIANSANEIAGQGNEAAGMDSGNERAESSGGGNDSARTDLQLDSEITNPAASLSLIGTSSLFNQLAKSAITLYDIESIFRDGGNYENSTLRIAAHFSKELSDGTEFLSRSNDAEYLKLEYLAYSASQSASKGFDFDGKKVAVLFDESGVTFSIVNTNDSVKITWEQAAEIIEQLVTEGKYVSADGLADALENEKLEIADILWTLDHDGTIGKFLATSEIYAEGIEQIKTFLDEKINRYEMFQIFTDYVAAWANTEESVQHGLPQIFNDLTDFTLPVRDIPDVFFSTKEFIAFDPEEEIENSEIEHTTTSPLLEARKLEEILSTSTLILAEVDAVLRDGANNNNSYLRIAARFSKDIPARELTEFLRREYLQNGRGWKERESGKGFNFNNHSVCAWFNMDGISLAIGTSAKENASKITIPWELAAERISELFNTGQYITREKLAEALENERGELANNLWNFYRDDMGKIPDEWKTEHSGYTEDIALMNELLDNSRQTIIARVIPDLEAYNPAEHERHWHSPSRLLSDIRAFARTSAFPPQAVIESPKFKYFITQDEIDAELFHGSPFADGKFRILSYYLNNTGEKERTDFLKNEFGLGGGGTRYEINGHQDHSPGKGIKLIRGGFEAENVQAEVTLKWPAASRRVAALIASGQYMTRDELNQITDYEKLTLAKSVQYFYYDLLDENPRVFEKCDFNYPKETDWNALRDFLSDNEQIDAALEQMRNIFANTSVEDRYYNSRKHGFENLTEWKEGTFTLFPGIENLPNLETSRFNSAAVIPRSSETVINLGSAPLNPVNSEQITVNSQDAGSGGFDNC